MQKIIINLTEEELVFLQEKLGHYTIEKYLKKIAQDIENEKMNQSWICKTREQKKALLDL